MAIMFISASKTEMFRVSNGFAVEAMIIGGLLEALYSIFW
jgi:hypothetical protein